MTTIASAILYEMIVSLVFLRYCDLLEVGRDLIDDANIFLTTLWSGGSGHLRQVHFKIDHEEQSLIFNH